MSNGYEISLRKSFSLIGSDFSWKLKFPCGVILRKFNIKVATHYFTELLSYNLNFAHSLVLETQKRSCPLNSVPQFSLKSC